MTNAKRLQDLKAYLHAEVDLQLDAMNKLGYLTEANVDQFCEEDVSLTLGVRDIKDRNVIRNHQIECTITLDDDFWCREFRALNEEIWSKNITITKYGVAYIEPESNGGIQMQPVADVNPVTTMRINDSNRLTGRMLDVGSGILEYDDVPGMDSVESWEGSSVEDEAFRVEAQAHIETHSPTCKVFAQHMDSDTPLPVPDGFYHMIRYNSAMTYVYDGNGPVFKKVCAELNRVLAKGGMLVIRDGLGCAEIKTPTAKELEDQLQENFPGCCVSVFETYPEDEELYFIAIINK